MFRYFARLHEKFNLPVYPVALLSYDAPRTPERNHYEVKFPDRRVLSFRYRVIQLNRLNWRDFVREPSPVAAALMTKMNIAPKDRPRLRLECLRMIVTLRLDPARSALVGQFMKSYLRLTEGQQIVYNRQINELAPNERRAVLEAVDTFAAERIRRVAVEMLKRRFGRVPQKTRKAIEWLSDMATEQFLFALLDFKDLSDADKWLERHKEQ